MGRALAAATRELDLATRDRRAPRPDCSHSLRAELEGQLTALYDKRPHPSEVDALMRIVPWLGRCARHEGASFKRTVPQAARGLGWRLAGSATATHNRHRNSLCRRLDKLILIGWVESWGAEYEPNGESSGLRIVLTPAGVAQSVRAAES